MKGLSSYLFEYTCSALLLGDGGLLHPNRHCNGVSEGSFDPSWYVSKRKVELGVGRISYPGWIGNAIRLGSS